MDSNGFRFPKSKFKNSLDGSIDYKAYNDYMKTCREHEKRYNILRFDRLQLFRDAWSNNPANSSLSSIAAHSRAMLWAATIGCAGKDNGRVLGMWFEENDGQLAALSR